jgi:hypothetical protein
MTCSCGKKLAAPVASAGKKVLCPNCNNELTVPAPAKPQSSAPAGSLGRGAPAMTPMSRPASYSAAPAAPTRPIPPPTEDLTFDVEPPLPAPPKPKLAAVETPAVEPGGDEYGLTAPKCPNCKAELARGAQFCVECGTALATGTKREGVTLPEKKKKGIELDGEMVKKIVIGVVAAAALAFGGWQLYKVFYGVRGATVTSPRPAVQPAAAAQRPLPPAAPPGQPPRPQSPTSE